VSIHHVDVQQIGGGFDTSYVAREVGEVRRENGGRNTGQGTFFLLK